MWLALCMLAWGAIGEDLTSLRTALTASSKWTRRDAVRKLTQRKSEGAWELLMDALADPAGEVTDTVQLALAAIPPACAELLEGKRGLRSKDVWVRRRTAEAFGRGERAFEPDALLGLLSDRDPEVRRMALWSLERACLKHRLLVDRPGKVARRIEERALRDTDDGVRARAWSTRVALGEGDGWGPLPDLEKALRDRSPQVRCMVAGLATQVGGSELALRRLEELSGDPSPFVRARVVDALASLGERRAFGLLVGRLEAESSVRLRWRVLAHLQRASGLKHRWDPRPWRDWWAGLDEGWRARQGGELPEAGRTVAFAGLPILSERLVFLIDLSGSIWMPLLDGRTRKEVVDEWLRAAILNLPESTRFNLVPYTEEPHPWREGLVPASPTNRARAVAYFEECDENGTGNFWDAALSALEDSEVDTLVVLTDGAPTGGRRNQLELLVELLCERHALRPVCVDSILVGAAPRLQRIWRDLADRTGGRSISVDLDGG